MFALHAHLVFVTKYRHPVFSQASLDRLEKIMRPSVPTSAVPFVLPIGAAIYLGFRLCAHQAPFPRPASQTGLATATANRPKPAFSRLGFATKQRTYTDR